MNTLVAATISLLLIGCDGPSRNQQKSESVQTAETDSATLSNTARIQSLPIPLEAEGADRFRLIVSRVHNPDLVPVEITTTLVASLDTMAIGSVALFPPDSGGVFAISLPQRARAAMSRSFRAKEPVRILIRLSDTRIDDVTLTVRIGGWE